MVVVSRDGNGQVYIGNTSRMGVLSTRGVYARSGRKQRLSVLFLRDQKCLKPRHRNFPAGAASAIHQAHEKPIQFAAREL